MANHKLYFALLVSFLFLFSSSTIAFRPLSSINDLPLSKKEGMEGYWPSSYSISRMCSSATEGGTIRLSCSYGSVISNIVFASFGNPQGFCGYYSQGDCDSPQTFSIVQQACLYKQSCTLEVSEAMFGTVNCPGTKKLAVEAICYN